MMIVPFRAKLVALLVICLGAADVWAADESIFRSGDEVVIQIEELDRLRQAHRRLPAVIRLAGAGGLKNFSLDLAEPFVPQAIVIDVAGYGACTGVVIDVKNGDGEMVYYRRVVPLPEVTIQSDLSLRAGEFAAIERGTAMEQQAAPRISLPDAAKLRQARLATPARSVSTEEITYPVVTDSDLPVLASQNMVVVSRQSFAAQDANKCSLYFSYRKAIYDPATTRLKKWRKFLVEAPLQRAWLEGAGDQTVTLPLGGFAVHATDEPAPRGSNMLGDSDVGLAQGGQGADTDDQGRIYFTNVSDGAGLVRFNPHTSKFEQPPLNFTEECRKLIRAEAGWTRSWDADLGQALCARGRVYIVFGRNYRVHTPNGKFETCSGVISVSQESWDDADRFRADIRLHAGSWAGAKHRLYDGDVPVGEYSRKLTGPVATRHGLTFASPADCRGGPWRLDLDDHGDTKLLVEVTNLADTVAADGTPLPSTQIEMVNGLQKQRMINVGSAGRQLVRFDYGQLEISRAALALILPGATEKQLVDSRGQYRTTYDGAPTGVLTVRFDIATAIKANRARYGELASALSGISLGPNYCITPIPNEPDRAIGVCEYGYYFSKLDFSQRATNRQVFKNYLPLLSGGEKTGLPAQVGLGPYNAQWAEHDGALWLYMLGYTGIARLKYAEGGEPLEAFRSEAVHPRLFSQPVDGKQRDNVKDYLHLLPALDGRLIDIGRGRPGRGGGAYSAGLELFDPSALGKSQTAVAMNRCYGLYTPVSRVVLSASGGPPRQEIYVASGPIRQEYVDDIADPGQRPQNREPKVFAYDCQSGNLRDLFGFSLPKLRSGNESSSNIALSPCRQFLIVMQSSGCLYSFHVAQRRFVDGMQMLDVAGKPVRALEFDRPSADLWSAPNGQLFFLTALDGAQSKSVSFFEVTVSRSGRLAVRPHLAITWNGSGAIAEFTGIVRCFLPDLTRRDGTYDFVLGGDQTKGQPTVRVIDDFLPPRLAP